jgi:hypothetical protein
MTNNNTKARILTEKDGNFKSKSFLELISFINAILNTMSLPLITVEQGVFMLSPYNHGKCGTAVIWRITHKESPQLYDAKVMFRIEKAIKDRFPQYIQAKKNVYNAIVSFGNSSYTTDSAGNPLSSIVIMPAELLDNIITEQDYIDFKAGKLEAVAKCLDIESRMYRRSGDTRSPEQRIDDFWASLKYEPLLEQASLERVSNLKLKHSFNCITMEVDYKTDFVGIVDGKLVDIEGKSTKTALSYNNSELGKIEFGEYFKKRLEEKSLGGLHNAIYVLFVLKATGDVICVEVANPNNNWYAGHLDLAS